MRTKKIIESIFTLAALIFVISCQREEVIVPEEPKTDIPDDKLAGTPPANVVGNTQIPNGTFSLLPENNKVILMNLSGIYDPIAKDWMTLVGTSQPGQNVWLSLDGKEKGILVINNKAGEGSKFLLDIVFLIDNSGSMGEESDAIAREIIAWAQHLGTKNLDLKFGCIGYNGDVTGATNLTDENQLSQYLNRNTGTRRTMGFYGADSAALENKANDPYYEQAGGECGMVALQFADKNFNWRPQANRVYINFTDEPNQPANVPDFSVDFLKDQKNWNTLQGTIHSVFSQDTTSFIEAPGLDEKPWLMADYTGGTKLFINTDASDLNLLSMPVTGAIANSYIIKFLNTSTVPDGSHNIVITVQNPDGTVGAKREFNNVWFLPPTKFFKNH